MSLRFGSFSVTYAESTFRFEVYVQATYTELDGAFGIVGRCIGGCSTWKILYAVSMDISLAVLVTVGYLETIFFVVMCCASLSTFRYIIVPSSSKSPP